MALVVTAAELLDNLSFSAKSEAEKDTTVRTTVALPPLRIVE